MQAAISSRKLTTLRRLVYDNVNERLLTMAAPEDRPEIAKLADDITIPTALLTRVRKLTFNLA